MTEVVPIEELREDQPAHRILFRSLDHPDAADPFDELYASAGFVWLNPAGTQKYSLAGTAPRRCRFCLQEEPDVRFRKDAHVIPQGFDGDTLTTRNECDGCNQDFGHRLDDQLVRFFAPYRPLAGVSGRKGKGVKHKLRDDGTAWISSGGRGTTEVAIQLSETDNSVRIEDHPDGGKLLRVRVPTYRPVNVGRALARMGLNFLLQDELAAFDYIREWVRGDDGAHLPAMKAVKVPYMARSALGLSVFRRRRDAAVPPLIVSFTLASVTLFWFAPDPDLATPATMPVPRIGTVPDSEYQPGVEDFIVVDDVPHRGSTSSFRLVTDDPLPELGPNSLGG